ncbi:MAG: carboxylesterase family protein [Caulobacter sp.]|nr:carboxylesterase family protein [Caulobacter sp.]
MPDGRLAMMWKSVVQGLAAAIMLGLLTPAFAAPLVDAPAGKVRGATEAGASVFRGVPYAQAPVGPLRWRPPEPLGRWSGERDATRFGAACVQPPSPFYDHPAVSEDCLFLNIWAPAKARGAPVIVWLHGGSLLSGAGSEAIYDGSRFAGQGVLLVSINYRLGPLGWLAHPGLSAESADSVSGNYGLLDQIEALRWVRRNIEAFGGDPGNVTIAGESAGALSVLHLMAAPPARGLFHRAIAQSGYMFTLPDLHDGTYADWPDAETIGAALAAELGATDVAALRNLKAEAIIKGAGRSRYFPLGTVDGRLLTRQLAEVFDRGEQAPVPVLAGYNEGEIRSLRFLLPPPPVDAAAYRREIRSRYGDLADPFLAAYPAETITESMLATTRDAIYGWAAERLAERQTALGAPAFLYYFDHGYPAADAGGLRAFHASEVPFVFGTINATPRYWPPVPQDARERRLSDAMLAYWATFARDGSPRAPGEAAWPPYGQDRAYMAFEDTPRPRVGPPNRYGLHEVFVCRLRARGGIAWHWNVGVIAPPLPPRGSACGARSEAQ